MRYSLEPPSLSPMPFLSFVMGFSFPGSKTAPLRTVMYLGSPSDCRNTSQPITIPNSRVADLVELVEFGELSVVFDETDLVTFLVDKPGVISTDHDVRPATLFVKRVNILELYGKI